jgi:hypothetical protein
MLGSVASVAGFFARFFLPVETSAIFVSELQLTPRARDSSFNSFKSFSSIVEYDE